MKDILKITVSSDGRTVGTGIRISRKRCIEIIVEIESVCSAELDADKIKIISRKFCG